MALNKGDIVLVRFPFSDLNQTLITAFDLD